MARTLNDLKPGERSVIIKISGKGPVKRRLTDMGITSGTDILVRKVAPLGDPIEVNIRSYELTLRKEDAKQILVN
ncbi:FeoA family protein [Syntrophobotulus glycolicus DSM 8271]|uniref:FeoA family protein n=1 Tax=Syntrophobotulus glycolicus (strain DSM 8271 / FlGlyR) TaxID=645991 RepID=F0SVL1_SYNGF|nr:FeoA family protein [Syntrophobotulus glycolicus]ADY54487.1 FeoA family protein [Syntrophobotulus glycolicus DSM 8271]